MKPVWKYVLTIVLPLTGLTTLIGGCSTVPACNNDACYDRNVSSMDPYKKGEIAAWGTEKEVAEQEEEKERTYYTTPIMRREP